ncbi:peptide synthetase [Zhihengliuella halotolerans]|uniref:peptide synthetase n=1 Tax=Zhihengliuella halotolerans TaxID=370736 RepID=UPI000C7F9574|nr:peptide synthetase [Zhihengliuella halotolerans]
MRLTSIAQLRLPFGRLYGYDVAVSPPAGALPLSFDQRRHVGVGERPGSWMGVSFRLAETLSKDHLAAAWLAVIARHGTLRSVVDPGDGDGPRLHQVHVGAGRWVEHPIGAGQAVEAAVRDVFDRRCTPFSTPSHRICVLKTAAGPTVIVAADHTHVDMWSMLVIVRDLVAALRGTHDGAGPALPPAPDFADHTRALADRPAAPVDVRRRWAEIMHVGAGGMPVFPLPLGPSAPHPERVEVRDVLGTAACAALAESARSAGVSTLTSAVSAMTAVTAELAGSALRAVFPVHSRHDDAWHDSVGWFITNSVLESGDPEPGACARAVKAAVRLGSYPLEELLRPWGGMPATPGMFAISWLDLRRLPVRVPPECLDMHYVGASIATDGVMLWFILDESGLHLRCRYPDTYEARANVGAWLDAVVLRLQAAARAPQPQS